MIPLKRLIASIESGVSVNAVDTPAERGQIAVLKTSCVYSGRFDSTENKTVVSEELDRVACPVRANTLVVSRMNTPDLVGAAGIVTSDEPYIYLPDRLWQVHFDLDATEPRFVYWWTQAELYRDQVKMACAGTSSSMQNLDQASFRGFVLPDTKRSAQERIANFLDEQTARIDALIAEKERLLERIDEYRLSVISTSVSLGLRAEVERKFVDDQWFPSVPEHWAFCPLNYRYEIQLGKMLDEKQITGEFLRPYLRNTDVQWGSINTEGLPQMDISLDEVGRYTVCSGDLLVCEGGDVGRSAIWGGESGEVGYQKALHRVRPRSDTDTPGFLFYLLFDSSKRGRFADREKATIAHLTAEAFRRYRFPFPPPDEQREIVAFLGDFVGRIGRLTEHCIGHIGCLREYRSSLISAAVTGQLNLDRFGLEPA